MRFHSLTEELNSITTDYDYGIVPGSAAVFVKDEVLGIGRLDLTLLEGVMVVIEVSDQGYKIASSSPLSDDPLTLAASEQVQSCVDKQVFETMDNLLMAASPLFRERFQSTLYDKLHEVQQLQLLEQQQQQQSSLGHTSEEHRRESSTTTTNAPIDQLTSVPEASSTSSSSSSSLSPALLSDPYTNVPMTTTNQYPAPTSLDSYITPASNHQDLMDEFDQWIH